MIRPDDDLKTGIKMPKIYLITSGEYSDYSIWCACSTKQKAERTLKILEKMKNHDEFRVEDFELDFIDKIPPGHEPWQIEMDKDGNVNEMFCHVGIDDKRRLNEPWFLIPHDGIEIMKMMVAAKDLKHAIKIVNEKRAHLIATGEWGKNRR